MANPALPFGSDDLPDGVGTVDGSFEQAAQSPRITPGHTVPRPKAANIEIIESIACRTSG